MTRHLGRLSLLLSASSWMLLYGTLLYGGIDPPPASVPVLSACSLTSALLGIVGAVAGIFALVRGRQRISGAIGSGLGVLFLLAFTGLAFVPFAGCSRPKSVEQSWASLPLGTDAEFEGIWFADSLNGWIVGGSYQVEGGLVGHTQDGGRSWRFTSGLATKEPGVFRFNLEAVRFLGPLRGIVATDGGKIFATDDGGENWRLVRYGRSATDHLFDLDFIDAQNGWAVGLDGVLRTCDGGETWRPINAGWPRDDAVAGRAICFNDERRGWLVGQHGRILWTDDGGQNWSPAAIPLDSEAKPDLYDVCFADDMHGWVVGAEGTLLHTRDGGVTWDRQETGLPDVKAVPRLERIQRGSRVEEMDLGERTPGLTLTAVRFVDPERGWVVGHYGYEGRSVVLRSDDGGASWRVEAQVAGEELRALFVLDADHAWTVGDRVREGTQVLLRHAPATRTEARKI